MKTNNARAVVLFLLVAVSACLIVFASRGTHIRAHPDEVATTQADTPGQASRPARLPVRYLSDGDEVPPELRSPELDEIDALSPELLKGDTAALMEMIWASRKIDTHFATREEVNDVVGRISFVGSIEISDEQSRPLRNALTELLFYNAREDHDAYLAFLRESGERVTEFNQKVLRDTFSSYGYPADQIPADPWQLLGRWFKGVRADEPTVSRWTGLILEGSEIRVFESREPEPPIGGDLYQLRGGIGTFRHFTEPPVPLQEVLRDNGKVLMADVRLLIAHDDGMGGVVWPYVVRYWFDYASGTWRPHRGVNFPSGRLQLPRPFLVY